MKKSLKVLSLFDGISCAKVAAERAGFNVETYHAAEIDKYAMSVAKKNHPDIIHIGDVNSINGSDYSDSDLLVGGSPCFTAGTKIITKDGYKNIEDVLVGDYVMTHSLSYKQVDKTGSQLSKTFMFRAQGVCETETTFDHPFYIRRMTRKYNKETRSSKRTFSDPFWEIAGKMQENDYVGIPIIQDEVDIPCLTAEDCWIIGRYIADGHLCVRKRKDRKNSFHYSVILTVGNEKLAHFETTVKDKKYTAYPHSKSCYRVCFYDKQFVELIESLGIGTGAKNKKISMKLLNLPTWKLLKIVEGYMSGDGCFTNNKYKACSISKELIMSLNLAVAKVYNVNSSFYVTKMDKTKEIEGRVVNQSENVYSTNFLKAIQKQSNAVIIDNIVWVKFRGLCETGNIARVYNLEVKEDNSYVANNVIVHNCTDLSISKRNREGLEGKHSSLFWQYARIKQDAQPRYFILENVASMPQKDKNIISETMGVQPIMICASLVSGQMRKRLFWTNIPDVSLPEDKGILLKDIMELDPDKIYYVDRDKAVTIDANYAKGCSWEYYLKRGKRQSVRFGSLNKGGQGDRVYHPYGKSVCLSSNGGGRGAKTGLYICLKDVENMFPNIRKLTPVECERLQGLPDGYTDNVSNTQRYKTLGNAFNVDVVAHIISHIPL